MTKTVRVVAFGDAGLRNALLAKNAGGDHLDAGLSQAVSAAHGEHQAEVQFIESGTLQDMEAGIGEADVVVLSTTNDVRALVGDDPHAAVTRFHNNLVSVFDQIKASSGAHVLVTNASTFDPADQTSSLFGLDEEPLSMRAHRVNLSLLQTSHEIGMSIIDVDRITAEAGCGSVVSAALELSPEGSALVRDETVRVLADYGFFDERSLVEQVGNRGGAK